MTFNDELLEAFHDLYDVQKVHKNYSLLKRDHVSLVNGFDALKNKYDNYMSTSSISCTKCEDLELYSLGLKNKLVQKSLELHV